MNLTSLIPYSKQISKKLGLKKKISGGGGYRKSSSKAIVKHAFPQTIFGAETKSKRRKLGNKTYLKNTFIALKKIYENQKMCLRSHIINGLLISFCSVCTGKYLPSVYPHRPRSFVAQSVRKPQANTFPYRRRSRLITLYYTILFN